MYALILVTPLIVYRYPLGGINLSLQRVFLLLAVLSAGVAIAHGSRDRRRLRLMLTSRPVVLALGALASFIVYEVARTGPSQQPDYARRFVGGLVVGFALITTIVAVLDSAAKVRAGIVAFVASAVLPVLVGLYQLLAPALGYAATLPFAGTLAVDPIFLGTFQADLGGTLVGRIPSTLAAPAFFGEFLVLTITATSALLVGGRIPRSWTVLAVPGLALAWVALIATVSRSAWLLMAVGLAMLLFHSHRELRAMISRRPRIWWTAPGLAVVLAIFLLTTTVPTGRLISSSIGSLSPEEANAPVVPALRSESSGRSGILTLNPPAVSAPGNSSAASTRTHISLRGDALRVFREHPVFGAGLGNLGPALRQPPGVSSAQTYGFTLLAEGGVVGFGLFVLFLGTVLLPVRQAFLRARGRVMRPYLLALYIGVALLTLTNVILYDTLFRDTSWVVLGLAVAAAGSSWRGDRA